MHILFVTRYDEQGASSRCRVYQYLPHLRARGISGEVVPRMLPGAELGQRAGAADAVFLQKRLPTLTRLLRLRRQAPLLLFDFDDAIWLRRRRDNRVVPASLRTRFRLAATLRLSDCIIAGNDYLAAYARRWSPHVVVLPTPVDCDYYTRDNLAGRGQRSARGDPPRAPHDALPPLRLGWVGHASNLCYLRRLEPVFAELAAQHAGLSLRVICSEPYDSDSLTVENIPWSLAAEVDNIRTLDIGLMPLDDDRWTQGKCGYKALQYMAAGVPAVCSPVGMNREIIEDGKNGLLAGDRATWQRQLTRLIKSPELRQRLGAEGQRSVARAYSLRLTAARLADLLSSLIVGGECQIGAACRREAAQGEVAAV